MEWMPFILIGVALLLVGFFSGIETTFISISKLSVELRKKQGNYSGRVWASFLEKPARFIVTALVISNILLVVYGLLWSDVLSSVWKYWHIQNPYIILAVETFIATFILIFIQFIRP